MAGKKAEAWLEIDGDVITFRARTSTMPDFRASYRFVVNSTASPKILRLVDWLGPGHPSPGHQAPQGYWYSLEGDYLALWGHAMKGEELTVSYRRAGKAK